MTAYSYEIGTTATTTNLESLATAINPPRGTFVEWSREYDRSDGAVNGDGYPSAIWRFDVLDQDMVDTLRAYCTSKSAVVYIKTRKNDGTFIKYSAIMIWPGDQLSKRQFNGKYLNLEIPFRKLVAV